MKRRDFIRSTTAAGMSIPMAAMGETLRQSREVTEEAKRKLFIYGGNRDRLFMKFLIGLTSKENPKICFVPTAAGDNPAAIAAWYISVEGLPLRPFVLRTFISSYNMKVSFEETILGMDAIVVGGGNTLNMLAIWRAQGIDAILRKAYDAGIVMSGGSAGSLCWFESGTTDSRPIAVSKMDCLGWIKGSHCPHYDSEATRRPLYHDMIQKGELPPGYACDDSAGIYFENERVSEAVSVNEKSKSYYVELVDGKIAERQLPSTVLKS